MQTKLISTAIAALFVAAPAFAATPAFDTATTHEFYLSGASAQEGQLRNYMRRACNTGTLTLYRQSNQFAFHCEANQAVTGTLTKPNIVVYKSSVGGSGNGTAPVANSSTLAFMDIATIAGAGCSAASTIAAVAPIAPDTIGLPAYDDKTCAQTLLNKTPDAGLSDVEPALFKGSVVGLDDAAVANLAVSATNQLIFGVPVTTGLRNALQTAQIANGTLAASCVAGDETEACMPSLTKSQVTGIYTGSIFTWDQLGLTNASDPYNAIWVARRVQSSGTQTSARVYFLNDPCVPNMSAFQETPAGPGVATNAAACSSADPFAAGYSNVFQGSGSGNVVTCMNAHDTNGRWAVGVLSTEFPAGTAGNLGYRFVKVDGSAPTLYNAANGNYQYVMEATMQWRNVPALAGDGLALATAIRDGFNSGVVVAAINSGLPQLYGQGGILGVPGANLPDNPITPAGVLLNPISAYTHSAGGSTNNCQPLQPTQSGSTTGG